MAPERPSSSCSLYSSKRLLLLETGLLIEPEAERSTAAKPVVEFIRDADGLRREDGVGIWGEETPSGSSPVRSNSGGAFFFCLDLDFGRDEGSVMSSGKILCQS